MELLNLMKRRRSIRKYSKQQIPRAGLEQIVEAGLYAPNAGGGQRSKIVAVRNAALTAELGRLNYACFSRANLAGGYVSHEQPSLIDDTSLKNGFYGAPTVCIVLGPKNFLYSTPDAYCCAENMALAAAGLGIASCIVARAEQTMATPRGQALLREWGIPDTMAARCFVLLGYCEGEYPAEKPRLPGRSLIVEG